MKYSKLYIVFIIMCNVKLQIMERKYHVKNNWFPLDRIFLLSCFVDLASPSLLPSGTYILVKYTFFLNESEVNYYWSYTLSSGEGRDILVMRQLWGVPLGVEPGKALWTITIIWLPFFSRFPAMKRSDHLLFHNRPVGQNNLPFFS